MSMSRRIYQHWVKTFTMGQRIVLLNNFHIRTTRFGLVCHDTNIKKQLTMFRTSYLYHDGQAQSFSPKG